MQNQNYMLADWFAILASFSLFSLVTVIPGYAFGWLLDILRFRQRTLWFRLTLSVPLSIALGPILSYLIGRLLSLEAVEAVYGVLCLYVLYLAARGLTSRFQLPPLSRAHMKVLGVATVWLTIAVLMLADFQIRGRLYYPVIAVDYSLRTAIVSSVGTYGVPAQNPLYFPDHPVALRYHYLWLIQCALVGRLGGPLIDARQALIGGTMWCGIGMLCLVPLYLRLFSSLGSAGLYRRTLAGLCLMGVTGLDILPSLIRLWLHFAEGVKGVSPSVEWWNEQVDGRVYTMLWEPHYVCSLIACLTAFLILWDAPEERRGRRTIASVAAGLALATAVGAGIYVAFVFAVFLALWALLVLVKRWRGAAPGTWEITPLAVAGAAAMFASLPFLLELRRPAAAAASGPGGLPIRLAFRNFDLLDWDKVYDHAWQALLTKMALLPLNYFLELGFFFAVGWLVWKHFREQERAPTRQEWAAFLMAGTSVTICTFLKSSAIVNNDLGWRGFLPAQFILLLWGADLVGGDAVAARERIGPRIVLRERPSLAALLLLGAAGTIYDLAILRFYPLWADQGRLPKIAWMSNDDQLGKRTYAGREAYQWLRSQTPPRSIVQQNPDPEYQDTFYLYYANRQAIVEDRSCSSVFTRDTSGCEPIVSRLTGLFAVGANSQTFQSACENLPIDVVVAKDTDRAWSDRASWVWMRKPIFSNDLFRLFPCKK